MSGISQNCHYFSENWQWCFKNVTLELPHQLKILRQSVYPTHLHFIINIFNTSSITQKVAKVQFSWILDNKSDLRCMLAGSDLIREVGHRKHFHYCMIQPTWQHSLKGKICLVFNLGIGSTYFSLYCRNYASQQGVKVRLQSYIHVLILFTLMEILGK